MKEIEISDTKIRHDIHVVVGDYLSIGEKSRRNLKSKEMYFIPSGATGWPWSSKLATFTILQAQNRLLYKMTLTGLARRVLEVHMGSRSAHWSVNL